MLRNITMSEMKSSDAGSSDEQASSPGMDSSGKRRRFKWNIWIRRLHLYAGLFLLPWVFLYGITGAMFNHPEIFPQATIRHVPATQISALRDFPSADQLASLVVEQLKKAAPKSQIELASEPVAQFNNEIILEARSADQKYAVHIHPVAGSAKVAELPRDESQERLLSNIRNIQIESNPYGVAGAAVPEIMRAAGIEQETSVHPLGWCKLNFFASVDDQLARVTYVLRDGHVDVSKFDGNDEMNPRHFMLRLHTSHGQPPHWNARMFWSLILDSMALAMVTWGVTGLVMWWQLKRTRFIGSLVILLSLATATWLYFGMSAFYASTKL